MPTKKCSDKYGYGCTASMEYESENELDALFRYVHTHSGNYHLNVCRACENRKARECRAKDYKRYNYRKKTGNNHYEGRDYGTMMVSKNGTVDGE